MKLLIFYVSSILLARFSSSLDLEPWDQKEYDVAFSRPRRDVIEEEKFYNIQIDEDQSQPWVPGIFSSLTSDATAKPTTLNEGKKVVPLQHTTTTTTTTERGTNKPTGRGPRAFNENWIKLPFPTREEPSYSSNKPSSDLISSRTPRVDFVTQTQRLDAQESRTDRGTTHRARHDEIRTEFVRPEETLLKLNKPVYPRQALYYPEESSRFFYEQDPFNTREPPKDYLYDRRRPLSVAPRSNRYDDDGPYKKPKRIIYYAHLPDVRPPSYRYPDFQRSEDGYGRIPRYDYRFRTRSPYSTYRPDARFTDDRFRDVKRYRDLTYAGTNNKEEKIDGKVTAVPVLPAHDEEMKKESQTQAQSQSLSDDVKLLFRNEDMAFPDDENSYMRYNEPVIRTAIIDDPRFPSYF